MEILACPKCQEPNHKSGVINSKQGIFAKCNFTVNKIGKKNDYYVTKALQLYLEG
jgi:uncharacterized protein YbaR (Trm112 family)